MTEDIIQIFCGNGRGKTSAALGTAFKCLGDGGTAYVMLFDQDETERELLRRFEPEFKVFAFDSENALQYAKKVITTKECDVLVLDEILKFAEEDPTYEESVLELMELQKQSGIRLIMTGADITERIRDHADGVTEFLRQK